MSWFQMLPRNAQVTYCFVKVVWCERNTHMGNRPGTWYGFRRLIQRRRDEAQEMDYYGSVHAELGQATTLNPNGG
jgi:hypothetical protein